MEAFPDTEPNRKTAELLVEEARAKIAPRLSAQELHEAMAAGTATVIDIRYQKQLERDGLIPGAALVNTNEFESRCDPAQPDEFRAPSVVGSDYSQRIVVVCNQGYQSSLKAAVLRDMGLVNTTDLDGGMESWIAAGLPIAPYHDQAFG